MGALVALAQVGSWLVVSHTPEAEAYDAVLVLGSHEQDRLPAALRLAEAHPEAVVVLARPARPTSYNCYDCEHHVQRLIGWGLPPGRVVVMEARVTNSFDELAAVARLAARRGWSSVAVVTSAYHTRRVQGLARLVGGHDHTPRLRVVSADEPGIRPRRWWTRGYDRRYVKYEVAALVVNSWRYGVWPWEWLRA
jgi:uncharacterized SAM-binding protein YcdF (DUF218 family)